jgi:hypothetical protein
MIEVRRPVGVWVVTVLSVLSSIAVVFAIVLVMRTPERFSDAQVAGVRSLGPLDALGFSIAGAAAIALFMLHRYAYVLYAAGCVLAAGIALYEVTAGSGSVMAHAFSLVVSGGVFSYVRRLRREGRLR